MKLGMNIPFKTQAKTEVKVDKNNWVDDIDRDIIKNQNGNTAIQLKQQFLFQKKKKKLLNIKRELYLMP